MFDQLLDRAAKILAQTESCALATKGPAGVQASIVPCQGYETILYLSIPNTSNHLFNLEYEPEVALATRSWSLRGTAVMVDQADPLTALQDCQWHIIVRVEPLKMHILANYPDGHAETIDFPQHLSSQGAKK